MRKMIGAGYAFRSLLGVAICAASLFAAPFLIDRNVLELVLLHADALTPVIALIGGAA
ncbi:MAG TPA: hypothetical protein VGI19_13175 [Candidatus Cybelea sp.]|jgi:hypothetical protein